MNNVSIVGRLTKDVELRYSTGEKTTAFAKFTVAVNRKFKNKDGNYNADFINCSAIGSTAEFVGKYFTKGMAIGLTGEIRTGSYINKEGAKVYTTEVVADKVEFVESKGNKANTANNDLAQMENDIFQPVDDDEDSIPF